MRRLRFSMRGIVAVGLGLSFALAGCAGTGSDDDEREREIVVGDNQFEPVETTARAGDTFEFENGGQRSHTVTVHRPPDAATTYVKDATLNPGDGTTLTFDKAGTYHVFCRFHGAIGSGMHMNVTVSA